MSDFFSLSLYVPFLIQLGHGLHVLCFICIKFCGQCCCNWISKPPGSSVYDFSLWFFPWNSWEYRLKYWTELRPVWIANNFTNGQLFSQVFTQESSVGTNCWSEYQLERDNRPQYHHHCDHHQYLRHHCHHLCLRHHHHHLAKSSLTTLAEVCFVHCSLQSLYNPQLQKITTFMMIIIFISIVIIIIIIIIIFVIIIILIIIIIIITFKMIIIIIIKKYQNDHILILQYLHNIDIITKEKLMTNNIVLFGKYLF